MPENVDAMIGDAPGATGADFDVAGFAAYLSTNLGLGGELTVERAAGGMSNPTYFVSNGPRRLVMRRRPSLKLSPTAHRIDREYRLLETLAGSSVPVPAPVLYCEDETVIGMSFYLMQRLEGVNSHDYVLPILAREARAVAYGSIASVMAALHRFDWIGAGLTDFGKAGGYFDRQLSVWSQQWSQFGIADNPDIDRLGAWLRSRIPPDDGFASITHGDFRPANIMLHADGSVSGVFDWELATIGHPLADLGFFLQGWFLRSDENGGVRDLDLVECGIPAAREFVSAYYDAAPQMPDLTAFHIAFALFRAAVGVSGVAIRAQNAPEPDLPAASKAHHFAKAYARAALEVIESWD